MLRRLLICLVAAAITLAAVATVSAEIVRSDDESDIELVEGTGRVLVVVRGALIGSLTSGRVEIKDLPDSADTDIQVLGDDSRYQASDGTTVYEGDNLRFRVFRGRWRVSIRGTGIFTSIVGIGSLRLAGDAGRYSYAGEPFRPWPTDWTLIRLGT